jgi:carboxyl-terminal processing protease
VPLIVLIDGDSASAAEIFAAAVRDSRTGTVVGQQSYGKGTVQGIFPLGKSGCGVRLTTAKFYSPSGTPISHRGVSPDLAVRKVARVTSEGQTIDQQGDDVLSAALQMARQQARRQ